MGSVFKNAQLFNNGRSHMRSFHTDRQIKYLASKKTDRGRNEHPEQDLQIAFCDWFALEFPGVHFRSDTGSGAFNSKWSKDIHNQQQSAKGLPDWECYAARRGYHMLLIEFKTPDSKLKRKRDATKRWMRKDKRGKIIDIDPKPLRLAGDWYDPLIERQHQRHLELREAGFFADFGVGLEACKMLACWYFDVEYKEPPALDLF